jgi:hypothetical protein
MPKRRRGGDADAVASVNRYQGFRPTPDWQIRVVDGSLPTAQLIAEMDKSRSSREPILLRDLTLDQAEWPCAQLWTLEHLRRRLGSTSVRVEERADPR